ncbi:fasciclin domain-containing protein [Dehalococcoides mccartyi]|uniref:fasciclin domain-containing protein n=1 Tax=Dehalococcoides mccartyi TaxID=61435 RepID=UPI002FC994D9
MMDLVDTAAANVRLSSLCKAVTQVGLIDILRGGPFTILAPDNDAFTQMPEGMLDYLMGNESELKSVLLYHIIPGRHTVEDLSKLYSTNTALDKPVEIWISGKALAVNTAHVITKDIETSNGLIHVIDKVLLPPK